MSAKTVSINFLSQQHKKITKQQKLDQKLFRFSIIGLVVSGLFVVVAIGSLVFMNLRFTTAEDEVSQLESQILANEEIEESAVVLSRKVSILDELIDQRDDKQQAIEYFTNLFGPQVVLRDISYQSEEGLLQIGVQTLSIFELERVIDLLRGGQTVDRYGLIKLTNLRRGSQGEYGLSLQIPLRESEPGEPTRTRTTQPDEDVAS